MTSSADSIDIVQDPALREQNWKPKYRKKFRTLVLRNRLLNMYNWLDILADLFENRVIMYLTREIDYGFFRGKAITYRTALRFVNRIGNALLSMGVRPGDRVAMITTNRFELAMAYFAAMKIGAIVVPLNSMLRQREIRYVVEDCGAEWLITDRQIYAASIQDPSTLPTISHWIMLTRREVPEGFESLSEWMSRSSDELEPVLRDPTTEIAILYTSGTTGYPKGAVLTEEGFSRLVRRLSRMTGVLPPTNRYLGIYIVPLAHVMGYVLMISIFAMGVPAVFLSTFDPQEVLETIQNCRGSFFIGVPTMYTMLLQANPEKYDLSSMKVWGSAADAFPAEHVETLKKFGGVRILGRRILPPLVFEGYGQVETTGITCMLRHPFFSGKREPGCVGKPVRHVKARLVDEKLKDVPPGQPGELLVKGPRVMKEYWNSPEMNAEAFRDGWFRTGDIMRRGRDGRLYFVDRDKDMIKVGGYSVFSKEVEKEMLEHPMIAEVAVIGVPDPVKGQKPVAVVRLKPGEKISSEELVDWGKENIAPYKAPREVILVEAMPYGTTLKIDKKELRKRYSQTMASNERTGSV